MNLVKLSIVGCVYVIFSQNALSQQYHSNLFRLGLEGAVNIVGDEFTRKQSDYSFRPSGIVSLEFYPMEDFGVHLLGFGGQFAGDVSGLQSTKHDDLPFDRVKYETEFIGIGCGASYAFPSVLNFIPVLFGRAGIFNFKTNATLGIEKKLIDWTRAITYGFGAAVEYPLSPELSARLSYSAFLTNTDELDGMKFGTQNDGISMLSLGLFWRINPKAEYPYETRESPTGKYPSYPDSKTIEETQQQSGGNPSQDSTGEIQQPATTQIENPPREVEQSSPYSGNEQPRIDLDDALPVSPARTVTRFTSELSFLDFANFSELRSNPEDMVLALEQPGTRTLPIRVLFELQHKGNVIASSSREITLRTSSAEFNARQFLDYEGMEIAEDYNARMPTGIYTVLVSARPQHSSESATVATQLKHIDLESVFGKDAGRIRYMIRNGKMKADLFNDNSEILLNVFGDKFTPEKGTSANSSEANNGTSIPSSSIIREAASAVPENVRSEEKQTFLSTTIRDAFNKALTVKSAIRNPRSSPEKVGIVVSEIYFPFDGAQLTDEAKTTLDYIGQNLNQHPALKAQIRGYADEIGDDAYNVLLSQRRADRVFEYLSRKQVAESRLRPVGFGNKAAGTKRSPEQQQHNRKVQIVLDTSQ